MRAICTLVALSAWVVLVHVGGAPATRAQSPRAVTVALASEPDRLFNPTTVAGLLVANLVFDPLVGLDDQMNPYPALAAAIPSPENALIRLSGDGADRRYIVTMPLRQDVTWSDGVPFTADDVVYTWQLMMNPRSGFDTSVEDKLKTVEKVDDFTVRFVYLSASEARAFDPERYRDQGNEPVIDPLYMFGLYDAPAIYPRHRVREIVGDDPRHSRQIGALESSDFARNPTGTGPYVLATWETGSALTFVSRGVMPSQRPGAVTQPPLDTVIFRVMPDKNDALIALSQDQIQAIAQDGLDPADATVLDTLAGVQAHYTPGNAVEQLTFNFDNPILADPAVRQAIAYGINRSAINDTILNGAGEVSLQQVPSWSWAFEPMLPHYEFDPGRSSQLLDGAGWTRRADGIRAKGSQSLSFKLWTTPASFRAGMLALIKDQLARIGIEVNIDSVASGVLFDTTGAVQQSLVSRQFDLVEFAWVSSFDAGLDALYTMHSSSIPTRGNGYRGGNYGGYRNPRVDQLLGQLQLSLDPGFRHIAMLEAQTIWQSDLPVVPLVVRPITTATSPRLLNFRPTPAAAGETWNIHQWDLR